MARFSDLDTGYSARGSVTTDSSDNVFESKMNRVEPNENDDYPPF
jgi:hypothetical protein